MLNKMSAGFIGCDSSYAEADIVLFGAPFDSTTSFRPGARFGPRAVRGESFGIETYSPYQDKDLCEIKAHDYGDIELCIGDSSTALAQIEELAEQIYSDGKTPVMLGGEHLVTLGAVRVAVRKYPGLHVVHFDAHADLRDNYLGVALSHACVMRRVWELVGDHRICQYGIRSGDRSEFIWGKSHVSTQKFGFSGLEDMLSGLGDKPVYFTIDLDVLDPSVFPGTGTPEAGGVNFDELLRAALSVLRSNVVGMDMVELAPAYDGSGASTALVCKLLREILLLYRKRSDNKIVTI